MANTQLKDTLEKMIKAFPGQRKLWGGRNFCEARPGGRGPRQRGAGAAPAQGRGLRPRGVASVHACASGPWVCETPGRT
jgi:hypothetical protein